MALFLNKKTFFWFILAFIISLSSYAKSTFSNLRANNSIFKVEVVSSEKDRSKGLMGREDWSKSPNGMLFVFEKEEILSFWMKGTLISMEIAFLNKEGKVVDIQQMEPPIFGLRESELKKYKSTGKARFAWEAPVGFFKAKAIKRGTLVCISEALGGKCAS